MLFTTVDISIIEQKRLTVDRACMYKQLIITAFRLNKFVEKNNQLSVIRGTFLPSRSKSDSVREIVCRPW